MKDFGNPTNRQFETQVPEINSGEIDSSDIEPVNVVPEDNSGTEQADDRVKNLAIVNKAKDAGYHLASYSKRPTEEKLRERHPEYTEEAVRAYFDSYDKKAAQLTHDSVLISSAKHLGFKAAGKSIKRPTEAELIKRHPNYTEEAVRAYLDNYDRRAKTISKDELLIEKAKHAGFNDKYKDRKRPTEADLKSLHPDYTQEAVEAYFACFDNGSIKHNKHLKTTQADSAVGSQNPKTNGGEFEFEIENSNVERAHVVPENNSGTARVAPDSDLIKKAKHLGFKAVRQGDKRPTEEELKRRHPGYTPAAVQAYLDSYDKKAARISKDSVLIEKAKHAGYSAKYNGGKRPTEEELKRRHPDYTQETVDAYFASFDNGSIKHGIQLKTNQVDRAVLPENRKNLLLKFPMLARTNQPFSSKKDEKEAVQVDEGTNQNSAALIANSKRLIIKVPMKAAIVKRDHQNGNSIMKVKPH